MAVRVTCQRFTLQRLMLDRYIACSTTSRQASTHTHPIFKKIYIPIQSGTTFKIHTTSQCPKQEKQTPQKSLLLAKKLFENKPPEECNKANFKDVVDTFQTFDVRRRGYMQFMETALKNMKKYGVEKDVDAYNMILDIFPKGPYVPVNSIQSMLNHFPEQQTMGVKILQHMEDQTIMPNKRTKEILVATFGPHSHPVKKYQRLMYWMPKFWNLNPFPLPEVLPEQKTKLYELGLKRIAEYEAKLSISYLRGSYPDSENPEFIATMQSEEQKEMLAEQATTKTLYVEGAFTLWLRSTQLSYFILRGDPFSVEETEEVIPEPGDFKDFNDYNISLRDYSKKSGPSFKSSLQNAPNPIQEGPIFAMCMATRQTEETLRHWITTLQEENPHLANIPVYFNLFNLETDRHHVSELIGDAKYLNEGNL